jgi:hypothetical protein
VFVASAQVLKTTGHKGRSKESDVTFQSSPFLLDQDLTQRDKWWENSLLLEGLAEHVEKLGDAMNVMMLMAKSQEHEEEDF